jgi:hypothetical protein
MGREASFINAYHSDRFLPVNMIGIYYWNMKKEC